MPEMSSEYVLIYKQVPNSLQYFGKESVKLMAKLRSSEKMVNAHDVQVTQMCYVMFVCLFVYSCFCLLVCLLGCLFICVFFRF